MDRFALLTVRRMFSLLYYPGILAQRQANVKCFFPVSFFSLLRISYADPGYNDSSSPTMVPGAPVKADSTSTSMR